MYFFLILFKFPTHSLLPFFNHHQLWNYFCHKYRFIQSPALIIRVLFFFWYYSGSNFQCYYTFLLQFQMPCKGVKYKQQYTEEDVEKAVEKVRHSCLSYCQAKEIYSVPTSTISDKINRICMKPNSSKPGPECCLSPEIEQRIYKWLLKMARIGYGRTKPDLFDHIQMIVCHLKILTLFVDDWPREKWYRLFLHQFPDLALWQVQLLSKLRARVSRKAINQWFDELQEYLNETANMHILEQPNKIYNCDETGFPMVPRPTKVIASKGYPHIYQQGASTKAQITVLLTASAYAH